MDFKATVIEFVKRVPKGKVVSYGQVAAFCGHPRAARQVGQILRNLEIEKLELPWWRVLNNQGVISIKGNWTATKELQKDLLLQDGVEVKDFKIDPSTFWHPNIESLKNVKTKSKRTG